MKKLTIELVPKTAWFKNLRSELSKEQWDRLRKDCYRQANYICECCGGKGDKWPVECHEVWKYDDKNKLQTLIRLISLCPSCHEVKHIGLASIKGRKEIATKHLSKINGWGLTQTENYINAAFSLWQQRSKYKWSMDISWTKLNEKKVATQSEIKL